MSIDGEAVLEQDVNKLIISAFLHDIGKPFARIQPTQLGFHKDISIFQKIWQNATEEIKKKQLPGAHFITTTNSYHRHVFWGSIITTYLTMPADESLSDINPFDINQYELDFWQSFSLDPYLIKASILLHHFNDPSTAKKFLTLLDINQNTINLYLQHWHNIELIRKADHDNAKQDRNISKNFKTESLTPPQTIYNMLKITGLSETEITNKIRDLRRYPLTTLDASHRRLTNNITKSSLDTNNQDIFEQTLNRFNITSLIVNTQDNRVQAIENFYPHLKKLFKHAQTIENKSQRYIINILDIVVQRYLYFVPADLRDPIPVVSLYEHLYSTALLTGLQKALNKDDDIAIVTFDFSGIQKYIYNIKAKKYALKTIKARSFLVQMQLKSIKHFILDKLKIPSFFVISDVAGKVIMAIPNYNQNKNTIEELRQTINNRLFETYQANISINIGIQTISYSNIQKDFYAKLIGTIKKSISETKISKRQPLYSIYFDSKSQKWQPNKFVTNYKIKKNAKLCTLCQSNIATSQFKNIDICKICEQSIQIGGLLPQTVAITWNNNVLEDIKKSTKQNSKEEFNLLFHDITLITHSNTKQLAQKQFRNFGITITDFGLASINTKNNSNSLYNILSNANWIEYVPLANYSAKTKENSLKIKSFNTISKIKNSQERTYLAVLKGDVDNLGMIFKEKLQKLYNMLGNSKSNRYSLSYVRTLSFSLKLFFEIFLNILIQTFDKYENNQDENLLSTLYIGGDDFLIVGRWDKIIKLTGLLDLYWKKYTQSNPYLTFSASIFLFKPNTPFLNVVEKADEYLTNAKYYDPNKNKFALQNIIFENRTPISLILKTSPLKTLNKEYTNILNTTNSNIKIDTEFLEYLTPLLSESKNSSIIYNTYQLIDLLENTLKNTQDPKLLMEEVAKIRAYIYYLKQRADNNKKDFLAYIYKQTQLPELKQDNVKKYILKLNSYKASFLISQYLIRYNLIKK